MPDSLAKEIHDASQDGRLAAVDLETVLKWIRMALDLEHAREKIGFVKSLIIEKSPDIGREKSFTAGDMATYFESLLGPSTKSVVMAALYDLSTEGKIVALDPGQPTIYSFPSAAALSARQEHAVDGHSLGSSLA